MLSLIIHSAASSPGQDFVLVELNQLDWNQAAIEAKSKNHAYHAEENLHYE
jgi:hypothetical protein